MAWIGSTKYIFLKNFILFTFLFFKTRSISCQEWFKLGTNSAICFPFWTHYDMSSRNVWQHFISTSCSMSCNKRLWYFCHALYRRKWFSSPCYLKFVALSTLFQSHSQCMYELHKLSLSSCLWWWTLTILWKDGELWWISCLCKQEEELVDHVLIHCDWSSRFGLSCFLFLGWLDSFHRKFVMLMTQ